MEVPDLNDRRPRVSLAEFEKELCSRRDMAGPIEMPRNSGNRRTKSKQLLLDALAKLGATW